MRSCAISSVVLGGVLAGFGVLSSCESGSTPRPEVPTEGVTANATATPSAPVPEPENRAGRERDMVSELDALLIGLEPCGKLQCATFADARSAFATLLDAGPRVLGIGESHVMKGMDHVTSTTERFQNELLPELEKRGTSELVVELLKPAPECEKPVERVAQQEKKVTEQQAPENKNRFVNLGVAAKERGIVPYLLEPECPVYQSIAEAGDDAVLRLLEVIATETERRTRRFYERQLAKQTTGEKPLLIVTYGGALHNDVEVEPAKAKFSFGPAIVDATKDRYLEVDLIVPEFIADTEVWRKLPWYASFDRSRPRTEATLIRTGPRSFVIVFPHTPVPAVIAPTSTTR